MVSDPAICPLVNTGAFPTAEVLRLMRALATMSSLGMALGWATPDTGLVIVWL